MEKTIASSKMKSYNRTIPALATVLFLIVLLLSGLALNFPVIAGSSEESSEKTQNQVNDFSYVVNLTPQEKLWIKSHPVVGVSNEFDWPPFDFVVSGIPQGFGIDLMELLSKRSGIAFKYINGYTWDELVEMFFAGQIDILHSLSITPERAVKAYFSPPYYHSKNVLILRRDVTDTNDLEDLEGRIIALPRGWSSIQFFKKYYPNVHIIEVESSRQALEYVDQGKVFATVEQEGIAAYFIKKFGFHDLKLSKWIENEELQKTSSMHFAILKDQPVLFTILKKALATIQPDDMTRLEEKWFGRQGQLIGSEDVGLTPSEREFLKEKEQIKYCIAPERMPFEAYQNDQVTGMTSDFLQTFSDRLGIPFILVPTSSWNESLAAIKNEECDILPMDNETSEQQDYIDFTSAYLNYSVAIITREREEFIGGLQDMPGKRVAVPDGSFIWDVVTRKFPDIVPVRFSDINECLLQLSSGGVDAVLLSLPVATYHIRHKGLSDLKVAGYSGIKDTIRIGVRKSDTPLHSIMSKLVRALPAKDVDSVSQKWISLTFEHRFDYSLMWKILSAIGILLILIILWNWQLMRWNRRIAHANKALEIKSKELEQMSITDVLTGLYNRRYIQSKLDEEMQRNYRYRRNLSVILIDLDNFKLINDKFGHQEGDAVLETFAGMLKSGIRDSDFAGRWGGEEFLVICPENDLSGAMVLAENLRRKSSEISFPLFAAQTASFGVAECKGEELRDNFVRRADDALYLAKKNGRNRVEMAE